MKSFSKLKAGKFKIMLLAGIFILLFFLQNITINSEYAIKYCYDKDKKYLSETCFSEAVGTILTNNPKNVKPIFVIMGEWIKKNNVNLGTCHILEHKIGETLAELHSNNFNNAFNLCIGSVCSHGCIHGIPIYILNKTEDLNKVIGVCEVIEDSFVKNQCYHGIGHAAGTVYEENVSKGVELCGKLGDKTRLCFDGLVHELLAQNQRETASPEILIEKCRNTLDEKLRETCYIGVGFFLPLHRGLNFSMSAKECFSIETEEEKFCIKGIGLLVSTIKNLNITFSNEICKEISSVYLKECIDGVLYGIFYFGNVYNLTQCEYFEEPFKEECRRKLREYGRFLVA